MGCVVAKFTVIGGSPSVKITHLGGIKASFGFAGGGITAHFMPVCSQKSEAPIFEELPYLVCDKQIYDTMLHGNNRTTIEIKFKRTQTAQTAYLLGSYGSSATRLNATLKANGNWNYGRMTQAFNTRSTEVFEAKMTPTSIQVGSESVAFTANEFETPFTLCVGGYTSSDGLKKGSFVGYIYYFRMSIDDVQVIDWIPVRRLSDGVECFWDKVTQSFVEPLEY